MADVNTTTRNSKRTHRTQVDATPLGVKPDQVAAIW